LTNSESRVVTGWPIKALRSEGFRPLEEEWSFDLVKVYIFDMGFYNDPHVTWGAVYARAKELGLEALPAEAGPALRIKIRLCALR
jgi:hypothetical protein